MPKEVKNLATNIYPNPVERDFYINFTTETDDNVTIQWVSSQGIVKRVLFNEYLKKGTYNRQFDLSDARKGVHLIVIKTGNYQKIHKIIR